MTRAASERWLRRGVNVLNGFVGDHLHARQNSLAIEMAFQVQGRPLRLDPADLRAAFPRATPRLCVLVHGLACDETVWQFKGGVPDVSYGSLLEDELGYTPLFLRYNTGLAIERNGASLARVMEELLAGYPGTVDEIVLIGHSMGGLVMRSACQTAAGAGQKWLDRVRRTITLGAPLDGADLARFAHVSSALLRVPAHPVTGLLGDVIDVRSRGIKDLQLGWRDPSLPAEARHYEIFGALNRSRSHLATRLFGDGLVRGPRGSSGSENVRHFPGVGHLELASSRDVYRQILEWCRP
jgi:triacylglycerol lipase